MRVSKSKTNQWSSFWDAINGVFKQVDRVFDKIPTTKAKTTIRIRLTPSQLTTLIYQKKLTFKVKDDTVILVEIA
jgi:hypothetical protein